MNTSLSCVQQIELPLLREYVLQVAAYIKFQTYWLVELLMTSEEGDAQKGHKLCVYFIKLFSWYSGDVVYTGSSTNCQYFGPPSTGKTNFASSMCYVYINWTNENSPFNDVLIKKKLIWPLKLVWLSG